ncbi:MAG TPA: amidohydrolase family protein [Candidatus Dormibacteraeota bacterium]|nr:amidohydrolase family protein [Candidatus Dormibacteraeota bacterium]
MKHIVRWVRFVRLARWGIVSAVTLLAATSAAGQATPLPGGDVNKLYEKLLKQIDLIPIYDNHSHATFPDDSDMDAMASPPEASSVLRLRDDNPEFVAAAKALFGYPYDDFQPAHAKWLIDKKKAAEQQGGTAYFDSILDKLNVETCLANRVALAPYLNPKRFHWVFFVDSFLFPFDNHDQIGKNGDMAVYIPLQEKVLQRYKKQESVTDLPKDLAGYESFVRQTLADNQKKGGVAVKFEAAYFRSLYFSDPPRAKAEEIYAKYRGGDVPSEQDYRLFQDYIFRVLIEQAGKLGLPVHFHSAVGPGDYFSLRNGNPLNLENVLRDPRYSKVKFVLIHGGYPYTLEMIWLTAAKNVYTDSSLMGYYVYPSELKNILKQWISLFPEKMMFASDAFPFNEAVGAEETYWLAVRSARTAVAAALAELVAEGAFSEAQALELAHLYLHDNAARLYGEMK